jgi:hypothetical protein
VDGGQNVTANKYSRKQPREERKHALPDTRNTLVVGEEDITIQDDLKKNQRRIEDSVGIK